MIFNLVVIASLVLAGLYILSWIGSGAVRARIEKPKYRFQAQLDRFDRRQQAPESREDKSHARP